jgi:hypothetical protein
MNSICARSQATPKQLAVIERAKLTPARFLEIPRCATKESSRIRGEHQKRPWHLDAMAYRVPTCTSG